MGMSALDGAERKGREAFRAGKPRSACPYEDKRGHWHNMITWSRAFITAWNDGWDEAKREAQDILETNTPRQDLER